MIRLPRHRRVVLGRMAEFWVYGTGPAALLLLLLAPYVLTGQPWSVCLVYLSLPAFMLHQVEEYDAALMRRTAGGVLGPKQPALSLYQVAIINLGLGWVPVAATLWLVLRVGPEWAVLTAWLLLCNAALHLTQAAVQGRYNPGLGSALALFLPLSAALLVSVPAGHSQHMTGLLLAVLLHLLMLAVARTKPRRAR